jgi:hypothetical protein
MAAILQGNLFSWEEISLASDLDRLRLVIDTISLVDEPLMVALETARANGQNKYPIRQTWHALLAGIVFQHSSIESLRRELRRNGELRNLCGFDALKGVNAVPSKDGFSHFLCNLMKQDALVTQMFHGLIERIREHLPDLGEKLAVDSKAIPSFGKSVRDKQKKSESDRRRDCDADVGVKTYSGTREDGTIWTQTKRWFGYKLHLLVDSVYELPLAFGLDVASSSDTTNLLPLIEDLQQNHLEIHRQSEQCSADKGYDSAANNRELFDRHSIKPVIDSREMWKDKTQKTLYPNKYDVFSYDEVGRIFCTCPSEKRDENETRQLAFAGFEKGRNTLKYRCPAAAYGFHCEGRKECENLSTGKVGPFGRIVRVPLETNRRSFTPIARHTEKWKRAYKRRSSVERVNGRIDQVLGFEKHTIRGKQKMTLRISIALIVMLAMALGRIQIGQMDKMRSLLQPIEPAA